MFKRFLYIIFIIFFMAISPAMASDFKILGVSTDFSGNMITLKGNTQSINVNYSAGFSENPIRAYMDLDDCIFVENKKTIELNNGNISKIVIAQYSANPNKVRLVFYAKSLNDLKKIKLVRNANSLTFKLNDFSYEANKIPVIFSDVLPKQYKDSKGVPVDAAKFSKYILTAVNQTSSGLMVSGIGTVKLSRPFILMNPVRIVFDMQNAISQRKDFYGEYKLENGDSVKIGQYNADTLRFVVTTENPVAYKSFISPDVQSLYIVNSLDMKDGALTNTNIPSTIKKLTVKQTSPEETYITLEFDQPVIHALRRTYNKFLIDFLNVDYAQNAPLVNAQRTVQFGGFSAQPINEHLSKLALLFPVSDYLKVETGMSQDGRLIAIKLTGSLSEIKQPATIAAPVIKKGSQPLKNKVIIVDAGHGGKDAGAISGKMYEKVAALKISQMLQKELEEKGAKVIMTRKDDTFISLQDRVTISNYENADLFVSIHLNSSEKSSINGIETHWYKPNSQILAQHVQNSLMRNIKANNRGLFKSMFYVINHTTAPAILVETGFISNPAESNELFTEARQKATAKAVCDGIVEYFAKRK